MNLLKKTLLSQIERHFNKPLKPPGIGQRIANRMVWTWEEHPHLYFYNDNNNTSRNP